MKYEIKTLSPLSAQTEKKTVLFTCCCDMLFAVILTLHSARMLPKFYNLRSKEKWFLVRPPRFFSFYQHATACQSWWCKAGTRWKDWQEDPVLREKNCLSESVVTVWNELQHKNDKTLNTGCSFRFRNICCLHFIELELIWVIWREGAIGGNVSMLCLN